MGKFIYSGIYPNGCKVKTRLINDEIELTLRTNFDTPKSRSTKELAYQLWKENVCRPALIARDGNCCSCCGRYARDGEKLDIEHTLTKGSRPDLKRDLSNMTLMCRMPCHFKKTNNIPCIHMCYH